MTKCQKCKQPFPKDVVWTYYNKKRVCQKCYKKLKLEAKYKFSPNKILKIKKKLLGWLKSQI